MCGITGILNFEGAPIEGKVLKKMTSVLAHRGPDDEGFFCNHSLEGLEHYTCTPTKSKASVGLGHRRLSIIDLSGGHQPMGNQDGSIWITFNGEIYNYQGITKELGEQGHSFQTSSDTEVILHAYEQWGSNCVQKLRGMFAFAIWNQNDESLFLCRDRLGIKPLYFFSNGKRFLFASELKSILQHPAVTPKISLTALHDYLSLLYIPGPGSIFEGIHKLSPGCTLTVRNSRITQHQYWDLNFQEIGGRSEKQWCEEIIHKLTEAIELRMISDVPLGAFLSGGVDSSAVVALMATLQTDPVRTASIGFKEQRFNELPYARQFTARYATDHHEMVVSPDAAGIIDKLAWHYDEPFADSSSIPTYYVSQVAREKVTVALSGDGGDENFAGYRRYYFDYLENKIRRFLPTGFRRNIIGGLARLYPKADKLPQFLRAKTLLTNLSREPSEGYFNTMSWFQGVGRKIFHSEVNTQLQGYCPLSHFDRYFQRTQGLNPLSRIQYVDFKTYLVDDILTKVDRASMAHGLEVRVPLLDHEFVELAATVPHGLKLQGRNGKFIFKKALEPLVPADNLYRQKMGFSIPLAQWLRNELRVSFEKDVLGPESFVLNYLDRSAIETIWYDHLSGQRRFETELWAILFLEKWGRQWM